MNHARHWLCPAFWPGTVPSDLARQPALGTLHLEGNQLTGGLEDFAAAVPTAPERSRLFHFDASRNQLTGQLPDGLQRLGTFSPDQQFVMATEDGMVRRGAARSK